MNRRGRGLRLDRRAFWLAVAVLVAVGLVKLYGPLATARRQQDDLAALHLRKAGLAAEQKRLEEYKRQLASDAGLENAARREGYVRDGERRLVFIRPDGKPAPSRSQAGRTRKP